MSRWWIGIATGLALAWWLDRLGVVEFKAMLAEWLREPVWPANEQSAECSRWIYGADPDRAGVYWTSRLGMLNGLLPGVHVVAHYTVGDDPILVSPYLSVRLT